LSLLLALIVPILAACGGATASAPTAAPAAAAPTSAPAAEAPTAAAAGGTTTTGKVSLPELDPSTIEGNIITAGSSTVFPLTQRMAEKIKDEGYTGNITVDSVGTGAGFERFCKAGETDIANASRAIKKEEIANCAALSPAQACHLGCGQPSLAEREDPAVQPRHRQRHLRLLRRGDYDAGLCQGRDR
jgi:ABC-type phosphate transport system substrate-binding protein